MDEYGVCVSSSPWPPNNAMSRYLQAPQVARGMDLPGQTSSRSPRGPGNRALRRSRLHIRRPCVLPGTARDVGSTQETSMLHPGYKDGSKEHDQGTLNSAVCDSLRTTQNMIVDSEINTEYKNKLEINTCFATKTDQHTTQLHMYEMLKQNPNDLPASPETSDSSHNQNPFRRELFRSLMPQQLSASSLAAEKTFFTVDTIGGRDIHLKTEPVDRKNTSGNVNLLIKNWELKAGSENKCTVNPLGVLKFPNKTNNSDQHNEILENKSYDYVSNEAYYTDDEPGDELIDDSLIPIYDTSIHENNLSLMYGDNSGSLNNIVKDQLILSCDSGLGDDHNDTLLSRLSTCSTPNGTEGGEEAGDLATQEEVDELHELKPNNTPVTPDSSYENPFRKELFRTLMPRKLSASSLIAERTFFTVDTIGGNDYLPEENWEMITKSDLNDSMVKSINYKNHINENYKDIKEINSSRIPNSIVDRNSNKTDKNRCVFKSDVDCETQNVNINNATHINKADKGINGKTFLKYSGITKHPDIESLSMASELSSLNLSDPGVYDLVEDHLASIRSSVSSKRNLKPLFNEVIGLPSSITDADPNDDVVEESFIFSDTEISENNHGLWDVSKERLTSTCDSGLGECDHSYAILSRESSCSSTSNSIEDDLDSTNLERSKERVLCGNRVSQMTKTYNDIEAVTRLLQEKEKDLELAAKIGQQLLSRSKVLEERNGALESELTSSGDIITQLKHDLQMKTDLLQIYTNDVDDSSCETTPTGLRFINVDILHNRVKNLEQENASLRDEASQLAVETDEVEDREENLVKDVIKQLGDANSHANQLSDELAKKVEDSLRQQEEITQLLAQHVDLQSRNKRMSHENEELHNMVGVARECQQELTTELAELKEKYAEVLDLLHDTQEQLRRVQKKNLPGSRGSHLNNSIYSSPFNPGNDSIANELHSLNSIGEELSNTNEAVQNHNLRRAFETVRLTGKYSSGSHGSLSSLGYGSSIISTPTHVPSVMGTPTHMTHSMSQSYNSAYLGSRGSSLYSGESGHPSLDSGADSDASMHTDSEDNYPASQAGVPGWPGTPDLNSCLRRLGPGERPSHYLPYGCRTPDSIMSTDPKNHWPISPVLSPGSTKSGGSSSSGFAGSGNEQWRLSQKLQIVKPIEGSLTLHQWSRLATPHLGGLLEEREGVANKGGIGHNLNLEVYSMSDVEEDEEEIRPGKQFMSTSGIYTYTNSTILHPDDNTMITPSLSKTQVSVLPTCSGLTGTTPSTPLRQPSCPASRRGSTATFSTNVGLAKVLNERGTSQGHGWSPTATPANSPSGSRPGSPEPEGYKLPGVDERRYFLRNDDSNRLFPPTLMDWMI